MPIDSSMVDFNSSLINFVYLCPVCKCTANIMYICIKCTICRSSLMPVLNKLTLVCYDHPVIIRYLEGDKGVCGLAAVVIA